MYASVCLEEITNLIISYLFLFCSCNSYWRCGFYFKRAS